jgi:hypothetical protein
MWWNPINSIKHDLESNINNYKNKNNQSSKNHKMDLSKEDDTKSNENSTTTTTTNISTWGKSKWKFNCLCKEVCSYYENPRLWPTGKYYYHTK